MTQTEILYEGLHKGDVRAFVQSVVKNLPSSGSSPGSSTAVLREVLNPGFLELLRTLKSFDRDEALCLKKTLYSRLAEINSELTSEEQRCLLSLYDIGGESTSSCPIPFLIDEEEREAVTGIKVATQKNTEEDGESGLSSDEAAKSEAVLKDIGAQIDSILYVTEEEYAEELQSRLKQAAESVSILAKSKKPKMQKFFGYLFDKSLDILTELNEGCVFELPKFGDFLLGRIEEQGTRLGEWLVAQRGDEGSPDNSLLPLLKELCHEKWARAWKHDVLKGKSLEGRSKRVKTFFLKRLATVLELLGGRNLDATIGGFCNTLKKGFFKTDLDSERIKNWRRMMVEQIEKEFTEAARKTASKFIKNTTKDEIHEKIFSQRFFALLGDEQWVSLETCDFSLYRGLLELLLGRDTAVPDCCPSSPDSVDYFLHMVSGAALQTVLKEHFHKDLYFFGSSKVMVKGAGFVVKQRSFLAACSGTSALEEKLGSSAKSCLKFQSEMDELNYYLEHVYPKKIILTKDQFGRDQFVGVGDVPIFVTSLRRDPDVVQNFFLSADSTNPNPGSNLMIQYTRAGPDAGEMLVENFFAVFGDDLLHAPLTSNLRSKAASVSSRTSSQSSLQQLLASNNASQLAGFLRKLGLDTTHSLCGPIVETARLVLGKMAVENVAQDKQVSMVQDFLRKAQHDPGSLPAPLQDLLRQQVSRSRTNGPLAAGGNPIARLLQGTPGMVNWIQTRPDVLAKVQTAVRVAQAQPGQDGIQKIVLFLQKEFSEDGVVAAEAAAKRSREEAQREEIRTREEELKRRQDSEVLEKMLGNLTGAPDNLPARARAASGSSGATVSSGADLDLLSDPVIAGILGAVGKRPSETSDAQTSAKVPKLGELDDEL